MEQELTREEIIENYLNDIKEKFDVTITKRNYKRYYITADSKVAPQVVKYIFKTLKARHSISSGIDTDKGIEILYHMSLDKLNCIFNVQTFVDKKNPVIESVGKDINAFDWIEREIGELFGVIFEGHPNPAHLLLREDWPENDFPLRKDYPVE